MLQGRASAHALAAVVLAVAASCVPTTQFDEPLLVDTPRVSRAEPVVPVDTEAPSSEAPAGGLGSAAGGSVSAVSRGGEAAGGPSGAPPGRSARRSPSPTTSTPPVSQKRRFAIGFEKGSRRSDPGRSLWPEMC